MAFSAWLRRFLELWVGVVVATLLVGSLAAQERPTAAQTGEVRLRIRLDLPTDSSNATPRSTILQVQPLDSNTAPATIHVSEGATTLVTLPPGRYQITSTTPVPIEGHAVGWDIELPVLGAETELQLSQQNAVRVSPFGNLEPGAQDESASGTGSSAQPVDADTQAQIQQLLNRWVGSIKARDLNEQMSCYAPTLSRYFLKQNVSKQEVRRDKQRFLERYPNIRELALQDVKITSVNGQPEVTAVKSWDFGGQKDWTGQVLTHLIFQRESGKWVITSERERLIRESVPFSPGSPASTGASARKEEERP